MRAILEKAGSNPVRAKILALAGFILFGLQTWRYSHNQDSVLDEGAYLLKGWFFSTGRYTPFQDYGPLTNHMPLSFWIYGLVQSIFEPGIRTGRFFAVFVGLLGLLGLWIAARRLGNEWWGAAAVLGVAWNPAIIKMYSMGTSQVIVFAILMWIMVFVLGEDRHRWHLAAGAGLAGLLLMTRINLSPVLPLTLLYILWQSGRWEALWSGLAGIGVVVLGHLAWWPGILRMWAYWLPEGLAPFLENWRAPEAVRYWDPLPEPFSRWLSFFHGWRFHFLSVSAAFFAPFFGPFRNWKQPDSRQKSLVYLLILFFTLLAAHIYASLGLNYCVFCYPVYLGFFAPLGLLIMVLVFQNADRSRPAGTQVLVLLLILAGFSGFGFGISGDFGTSMAEWQVPRISGMRLLPGTIELWGILQNKFGWSYQVLVKIIPAAAGLLSGLLFLAILGLGWRLFRRQRLVGRLSFGSAALIGFLAVGTLLTPTRLLGGGYHTFDCQADLIRSYETVGATLAAHIPPGSRIFWRGTLSAVPLLYLGDFRMYPSQINLDYSLHLGGDPDALEKYGYWSDELGAVWVEQADYILVAGRYFSGALKTTLQDQAHYSRLVVTEPANPCEINTRIYVFENLR